MSSEQSFLFLDTSLPLEKRVDDLISRMSLAEKVSQMLHEAPAIDRLGIPAYNWWNECLHGVARAGIATVFPQAIGLAATWNTSLHTQIAAVISEEARAKFHEFQRHGETDIYKGLTFWSPNVNIFRDPRWGRGQETYGEDPYLTAQMGIVFVKELQGYDERYLKAAACAKHYAVHSGPENDRHHFNAVVSQQDLWDTYLPAFEALVREADVEIVMGAYNSTNDEPCCASPTLLQEVLRDRWEFDGHVTSDCWAIIDLYKKGHHHVVETREEATAIAVKAGCDLNCGCTYDALLVAEHEGLIDEATINQSLHRLFMTRFRLGMFDPADQVPYAAIPYTANDTPEHRALAHKAAREAIVLLKNEADMLPLTDTTQTIAVIGPNADDAETLWGNYNGIASTTTTPLAGIQARGNNVIYAQGCDLLDPEEDGFAEALAAAEQADTIVFVGGISQRVEGEENMHDDPDAPEVGDKQFPGLPDVQLKLLQALHTTGKPMALVLINGSPLEINWAADNVPAIIEAWYPGEEGGAAIADILFGDYNPAGRLPVTFYRSLEDIPPFEDYAMQGRTYRYFEGAPLYPFGYGLSYTTFTYCNLQLSHKAMPAGTPFSVKVDITNTGSVAGDEVVQLYLRDLDATTTVPKHSLQGFIRIHLQPGETQTVNITLDPRQFALVNDEGIRVIEPGEFEVFVGGGQPGFDTGAVSSTVTINGEPQVIKHLYGPNT